MKPLKIHASDFWTDIGRTDLPIAAQDCIRGIVSAYLHNTIPPTPSCAEVKAMNAHGPREIILVEPPKETRLTIMQFVPHDAKKHREFLYLAPSGYPHGNNLPFGTAPINIKEEVTVHPEPPEFKNCPRENCTQCGKKTRNWLTPFMPLCEACAAAPNPDTQAAANALAAPQQFKRTSWTNEEIRRILTLEKLHQEPGQPSIFVTRHNEAIDQAIARFHDLSRAPEESGAMALDTHKWALVHIGTPQEQ